MTEDSITCGVNLATEYKRNVANKLLHSSAYCKVVISNLFHPCLRPITVLVESYKVVYRDYQDATVKVPGVQRKIRYIRHDAFNKRMESQYKPNRCSDGHSSSYKWSLYPDGRSDVSERTPFMLIGQEDTDKTPQARLLN